MTSVVAIGCHPDDIESGCFGTLALLRKNGANVKVLLLTAGERGGEKEVRLKAAKAACSVIGATLSYATFEDGKLSDDANTVSWIEGEIERVRADIVFVPCPLDRHQDHRNGGNAGISASRKVADLLLYETPTTTTFHPQMYVDINETIETKLLAMSLHKAKQEQAQVSDAIRCLARYRAYQLRQLNGAIEAFQVVRWQLNPAMIK
jgi:LmbE family N-acetylglucosaminyl deacetylase